MAAAKTKDINMTEGRLFGKILLFILPLMATNLLQVLYNAADMVVVSMSHEPDAVGAIGTTGAFVSLILNIFIGFATGSNVVVARLIGAGDEDEVSKTVHTSILMSVGLGILGMIVGISVSRPVLALMGTDGKLLDLATLYTRICFAGIPFISITNYAISIFRAKGDTRTPLYILTASGLLNVVLNMFFVIVCKLSVEGVSLATAISNAVSAIWLMIVLSRDDGPCRFSIKKLAFDKNAFREIWKIGLPAGIQGSLFSISNMLIQSSILQVNNMVCPPGSDFQPVVKGSSAASNLESFSYNATNAVYQASITFTSQNAGAGKYKRIWRVMGCCYFITFMIATIFSLSTVIFNKPLLALYGVSDSVVGSLEHIAYETAIKRFLYLLLPYFTLAFMECGSGMVRGLGLSTASTVISLIGSCLMRIVWIAVVFKAYPTLDVIFVSYPISWTITAAAQFLVGSTVLRRNIRWQKAQEAY